MTQLMSGSALLHSGGRNSVWNQGECHTLLRKLEKRWSVIILPAIFLNRLRRRSFACCDLSLFYAQLFQKQSIIIRSRPPNKPVSPFCESFDAAKLLFGLLTHILTPGGLPVRPQVSRREPRLPAPRRRSAGRRGGRVR